MKKERPILFSGLMVRAILEGRKTQTRRVMKPLPVFNEGLGGFTWKGICCESGDNPSVFAPWVPGDRLWVRETFQKCGCGACRAVWPAKGPHGVAAREGYPGPSGAAFTPAIFMPRWASRITLEIINVRVQQVQEISHRDALAEGVDYDVSKPDGAPLQRFQMLWDSINGKKTPWSSNPWVWALTFREVD